MAVKGKFSHLSLYKLFIKAGKSRLNTILHLTDGKKSYKVYFKEGKVSFIISEDKDERFGEYLIITGRITLQQYRKTSEKILSEGKKFGYTLVEEGFMTVDELFHSLNDYLFFLIKKIFEMKKGAYAFLKYKSNIILPMDLTVDYRKAIYSGIKNNSFYSLIDYHIDTLSLVPDFKCSIEDILKVIPLTVEEQSILEWIDGENRLSSICNYSDLNEFETLKTLLALKLCGFIEFLSEGKKKEDVRETMSKIEDILRKYNEKFEVIYSLLSTFQPDLLEKINTEVFDRLEEKFGTLTREIDLSHYGYIDFDVFYRNLYNFPGEDKEKIAEEFLKETLNEIKIEIENFGSKDLKSAISKAL